MSIMGILVSLISGGVGGNIVGAAWKDASLGTLGNTIAGAIGGVAGGYILQAVGILSSLGLADMTVGSFLGDAGSTAALGALTTGVIGFIKNKMA
jgi:hypothetical protein